MTPKPLPVITRAAPHTAGIKKAMECSHHPTAYCVKPPTHKKEIYSMNHSTAPTPNTTEIGIATGVFDLDTLRAECHALGLPTDRPTLRRVRRAIDLHQHGAVKPFHNDGFDAFFVQSQTQAGKGYTVLPHSGCDCPDAKRLTDEFGEPNTATLCLMPRSIARRKAQTRPTIRRCRTHISTA